MNGKIRAREIRVIGPEGNMLGIMQLHDAISLARNNGMDLVEVAANATPPVCRVVDYGKYRYELAKKEKDSRKNQHANRVKEVQLSASIDPHDFGVKLGRSIDFLCEEMKVKISLRFRGREMVHQEFGRDVMARFVKELEPYGHAIESPKLIGKSIHAMINPLPRAKRAKNPNANPVTDQDDDAPETPEGADEDDETSMPPATPPPAESGEGFANNPFADLEKKLPPSPPPSPPPPPPA
jgi:translation initiation factor IF-3